MPGRKKPTDNQTSDFTVTKAEHRGEQGKEVITGFT